MIHIGDLIHGYSIVGEINHGAFCDAFIAQKGGKRYFLKRYSDPTEMSDDFRDFYKNQEIMMPRLNDLGDIVETIVDHFVEDGLYYQVKKLLPGINLKKWMEDNLDYAPRLEAARQLVRIVQKVHGAGIVHNDLKPEQVMVVSETPLKLVLTDFDWSVPDGRVVRLVHTPGYRCEDRSVTQESDEFTLGIILCILLTGDNPYRHNFEDGLTDENWSRAVRNRMYRQPRELNSDVSGQANDVIVKCLDPNPKNRPSLEQVLSGLRDAGTASMVVFESIVNGCMYVPVGGGVDRRLFKVCFNEVMDDVGNPIYRYISRDVKVLVVSREGTQFLLSSPEVMLNSFRLNGINIDNKPCPITDGDTLTLYSSRRGKDIATFRISFR